MPIDAATVRTIFENSRDLLLEIARTKRERDEVRRIVRNLEDTAIQYGQWKDPR